MDQDQKKKREAEKLINQTYKNELEEKVKKEFVSEVKKQIMSNFERHGKAKNVRIYEELRAKYEESQKLKKKRKKGKKKVEIEIEDGLNEIKESPEEMKEESVKETSLERSKRAMTEDEF